MSAIYYIAGNSYEGCGHRHRSARAAQKCANKGNRVFSTLPPLKVYKATSRDGRMVKARRLRRTR